MDMEVSSELLYGGKFLAFRRKGQWEYVERQNTSGCAAILAINKYNEIILVEQFRPPVQRRVIEIPAGLAGDTEGEQLETLIHAAKRELLEETGYEAQSMECLTEGPSSAGLSTELITFFRAQGLRKVSEGGGVGSEIIMVHSIALKGLRAWLDQKQREKCLIDYKIYSALYLAKIY
jgi:ADP-ribose pyrophosphatase